MPTTAPRKCALSRHRTPAALLLLRARADRLDIRRYEFALPRHFRPCAAQRNRGAVIINIFRAASIFAEFSPAIHYRRRVASHGRDF